MTAYHVTLAGQGLLIDPSSYSVRALTELSGSLLAEDPRPVSTDPLFERVQSQRRFDAGEGVASFADPTDPDGWRSGDGILPTANGVRIGPALVESGGASLGAGVRAFALFRDRLYAGLDAAPGEVWSFDGSAWSLAFTTGKPGVRSLAAFRDALYVGNGGDGDVQRWDGTTLTNAWSNAAVNAITAMAVTYFSGSSRLFLGNSVTSGSSWLQSYDGVVQTLIAVFEEPGVEAIATADGKLFVLTSDTRGQLRGSLFSYAGTSTSLTLERLLGDGYANAAASLGRGLYLAVATDGSLKVWDQSAHDLSGVTAPSGPGGGLPFVLMSYGGVLWVAARDAVGGTLVLRRFDAIAGAWSTPAVGLTVEAVLAMGVFGGALFVSVRLAGGTKRTYRADLATSSTSAVLQTAPFDGGLPGVSKAWRGLTVAYAPLPTGASIDVSYQLDGGAWIVLGSASTAGSESTSLTFPTSATGRAMSLRLTLRRGPGSADSPEVRGIDPRFVLLPPLRRAFTFHALLEGDAQRPLLRLDDTPEPSTGRELAAALWSLRAQPGPLAFVDLEGASRQVWFRDLNEVAQKLSPPALNPAAPPTLAQVTLVEA